MSDDALRQSVESCARNSKLMENIRAVYARIDDAVRGREAKCLGGGACCRFDCAGHRLYVTIGELALLTQHAPPSPQRSALRRCAYQVGPRCYARENRPMGCRLYFCDPAHNAWSTGMYERFHRELRVLHTACDATYQYMELTGALEVLFDSEKRR